MRLRYGFITGIALMAGGCANQDAMIRKQSEMEARLEYLAQDNKVLNSQVVSLTNELRELKERDQASAAEIRELKESALKPPAPGPASPPQAQPAASPPPKIELINNEAAAGQKADSASSVYMEAFGLYSANKYPAAVQAFTSFLETYPNDEFAVNAQYWIGECYYSQSDFPKSLTAFKKVIENYPKGKKAPDALLKIGYTLFALKEPVQARAALELLVEKFPESAAAGKAREKLHLRP
jgi:tol-pal system protein YbgF